MLAAFNNLRAYVHRIWMAATPGPTPAEQKRTTGEFAQRVAAGRGSFDRGSALAVGQRHKPRTDADVFDRQLLTVVELVEASIELEIQATSIDLKEQ